jgi:2-polyprenyl-3-methyl-5-hydroxy-6-metoxy-1,4-benzoquinol methylase
MDALDTNGIFDKARQAFHRARYEFALNHIADKDVVDVACGLGYGSRILKSGGAKNVIGIDISKEAVDYANATHKKNGIYFMVGDATKTFLKNASVDIIVSFETIEHLHDTQALLTEFRRILKQDGRLIISSPNDWGLTEYHCHTWTPFEFMAELAVFFKIESIWKLNPPDTADRSLRCLASPYSDEAKENADCLIIIGTK